MSSGTVTNRDTMITNEVRIPPSFITRGVESAGEAMNTMRNVRCIVATTTAGSAGSMTTRGAGSTVTIITVRATLKIIPRRVTTVGGLAVGTKPHLTVTWSDTIVEMAYLVYHVMPFGQLFVINFVNTMSILAITNGNTMITNEIRIETASAVATIRFSRRRGESRDEGAEEKNCGDG